MPSDSVSRRGFLAGSTAAFASAPFVHSSPDGAPDQKVRLAVVGVAARGKANLDGVAHEEIVALCDVDEANAADARKRFPSAAFYTDYRKMLDAVASKVDAVVVSTPDHNHALPALIAMNAGKHVYCEKPLAHSVSEVRQMQAAATKNKVVTQMGTQIHAGDNYRRVVEIVQAGKLGPVKRVHVWCSRRPDAMSRVPMPTPGVKFNADLWVGPAPTEFFYAKGPSNHPWPHFDWRWWWEFGGGVLADMACHFMDLPFWARPRQSDFGCGEGHPDERRRQQEYAGHSASRLPVPRPRRSTAGPPDVVSRRRRAGLEWEDDVSRLR